MRNIRTLVSSIVISIDKYNNVKEPHLKEELNVLFRLFFVITVILNASLSCLGLLLRVIEIKLNW